ncbi:MAG: hypothetical protein ACYDIC_11625 [Desulfobaccales bacterium]
MLRTYGKTRWPWEILPILIPTILIIGMAWLVWAQPSGPGPGGPGGGDDPEWSTGPGRGGRGGRGPGGPPAARFDPRQVITVSGKIESLGSYGMTGWRVVPGMAVQRLVLKTEKGEVEVDLGPPGYVTERGLQLKTGDTLEVVGFQAERGGRTIFIAAAVKTPQRELRLLDERGFPLWWQGGHRGPGPGEPGPDRMGPGGPERDRF